MYGENLDLEMIDGMMIRVGSNTDTKIVCSVIWDPQVEHRDRITVPRSHFGTIAQCVLYDSYYGSLHVQ